MAYTPGAPLISGLRFDVAPGEYVALIGASGAGKTTLLRMIAGLERRFSGSIRVGDAPVTKPGLDRQMVFQDTRLLPWLSALDNVAFASPSSDRNAARARAGELLIEVGLNGRGAAWPETLSGGERSRVALARALMQPPAVLLLDEPLIGLDLDARFALIRLLHEMRARVGFTCLIVSHDVHEATLLADRVLVVSARPLKVIEEFLVDVAHPRDPGDERVWRIANDVTKSAIGAKAAAAPPT